MRRYRFAAIFPAFAIAFSFLPYAWAEPVARFNLLVLKKAELEIRFGARTLECFTFKDDIGFDKDQAELVNRCFKGAETLASAMAEVPDAGINMVGVSDRFARVAGFNAMLFPWDASQNEIAAFLRQRLSPEARSRFIDKIHSLKRKIRSDLHIAELFCTRKIANKDCLRGYETLASVAPTKGIKKKKWRQVVIGDSTGPLKNPAALALNFSADVKEFSDRLENKNLGDNWAVWRRVYSVIDEKYGEDFRKRLRLPNFFCSTSLTAEECYRGANNFHTASADAGLQSRSWGEVMVHKRNTFIRNDIDVLLRYDLPPEEIVAYFSKKPTRIKSVENITLAEKLEARTKNNVTGLRAVCDLGDLSAGLCVKGLQTFISFVRKRPGYRARRPWTEIMFVDGDKLSRVNFALNSASRHSYIYVHAGSGLAEMEAHLMRFGAESKRTP